MTFKKMLQQSLVISYIFLNSFNISAQTKEPNNFKILEDGSILLEDFEEDEVGDLPSAWFNRNGDERPKYFEGANRETYNYKILEKDKNKFLEYDGRSAKHLNLPLAESDKVDIYVTPILSWRWRAWELPEGANEDKGDKNDAALSVYVVYKVSGFLIKRPQVIRYTWSSTLPKGEILDKGSQKIIVLQSGRENIGKWQIEQRNIMEDYKNLFGKKPPGRPLAILILSDADSTKSWAKGDYDDFVLGKSWRSGLN